ncbi:MAG: FtsW/RodA/SpoVE family cell cycle protein [Chloroflexaceae bacterium]|nr:FtsW/RodA/SpoVE family cell cycle protein [Chloroflexaceae bacterium]NJO04581.1 FtsW/RodA/SpoVE family cell cycle protein [Chloroflexaceae bacterium]
MEFLKRLRSFRRTEFWLLAIAMILFASGYLQVIFESQRQQVTSVPDVGRVLGFLWPSVLPFFLFLGISIWMSIRKIQADQILLPLVALLTGLGLMMIARLEPDLVTLYGADFDNVDTKQTLWVTIGLIILMLMLFVPWDQIFIRLVNSSLMDWLEHYRYAWLTLGLSLVAATFIFGVDPNNSGVKVWFDFGFFLFQPSELLKIILVIFLASYLDNHRAVVASGYRVGPLTLPPLPYLIPLVGMWGLAMGIIIFQRDLGAALLLFGVFLAMLYVAIGRVWYVGAGIVAFIIGAVAMYHADRFGLDSVANIVRLRVGIWLDPWATAQGTGYQIVQASYALASGGIFGAGLGRGIPAIVSAVHTDFIYTAIGEELGLAGTLAVLIAYLMLIFRGFHIAVNIPGRFQGFEQLLAVGLTSILAIQTFVIIGGNLQLIPLTGITLPFISYGGSSIIINFLIIGLLMRLSAGRETA